MTKKNKGQIPELNDTRVLYVPVGCGKCIECRNQKKRNWQIRLHEDISIYRNGKFVTLTFSNDELLKLTLEIGVQESNAIATIAVRRFLENWRKEFKKSVRHWLITELGHNGTERIHLHGILFTDKDNDTIQRKWKYGNIWVGDYVNAKTINYIVKYVTKVDEMHKGFEGVVLCSQGIGKSYMNKWNKKQNEYKGAETDEHYKLPNGLKVPLPIYLRNKIYSEDEREKLWLNKLDKGVMYIGGIKVNVNTENGQQHADKLLKNKQADNKRLGYGDDSEEWKKVNYNITRNMLNKSKKLEELKNNSNIAIINNKKYK